MAEPKFEAEFLKQLPPSFAALPFRPLNTLQYVAAPANTYAGVLLNSVEGTEKTLARLTSVYDMIGWEQKQHATDAYAWETNDFPPHLMDISWDDQSFILSIFNIGPLIQTLRLLISGQDLPQDLKDLAPQNVKSMADLVKELRNLHSWWHSNMYYEGNIGDREHICEEPA